MQTKVYSSAVDVRVWNVIIVTTAVTIVASFILFEMMNFSEILGPQKSLDDSIFISLLWLLYNFADLLLLEVRKRKW